MTETADAIIIGTGVIGTAVAFEMAKKGWKTLSLDRNAQIGQPQAAFSVDSTLLPWIRPRATMVPKASDPKMPA